MEPFDQGTYMSVILTFNQAVYSSEKGILHKNTGYVISDDRLGYYNNIPLDLRMIWNTDFIGNLFLGG